MISIDWSYILLHQFHNEAKKIQKVKKQEELNLFLFNLISKKKRKFYHNSIVHQSTHKPISDSQEPVFNSEMTIQLGNNIPKYLVKPNR